ncbi:zona pellucida sperm-binding protein 2-like [Rhinoraja longicauda]
MACMVANEGDDLFSLNLQIQFGPMERASTYLHTMSCSYFPWRAREILCEQNYMEVSVQRVIPGIENDYDEDWIAAVPSAQEAENAIWQVVFHLPERMETMTVNETLSSHYRIGTTVSRLLLRAPYNATEVEPLLIENVPVSSIRSTTFYKQEWMILLIDTTVACPTGGTTYTEDEIIWRIPRVIPTLSSHEEQFYDDSIVLGVNGVSLTPDKMAELNYPLTYNDTNIVVTIPIGAEGGSYKSHVVQGQYGIVYSIELLVEHQWELTKYTIIHPVSTPFMPRPPIVINNTIPEKRTFNVSVGNFLPDVELIALTIGTLIVPVDEADKAGFTIYEMPLPNNTKAYIVEVPFENENIEQEHLHSNIRLYIFDVIYIFKIIPENEPFHQHVKIAHEISDIVLPKSTGFCDDKNLYLLVTQGNLVNYWLPFIDQLLVTQQSSQNYGYLLVDNATHILIGVPLSGRGVIYEELSLQRITARLNLTLKDKNTMKIQVYFTVACNFLPGDLAVCFPNGTMVITAVVDTIPDLDPGKMILKDGKCQPKEFNDHKALFKFSINSCGTTRTIRGNYLIYENEVSYPREAIPVNFPVITRDPDYRLTVSCRYEVNNTLSVGVVKRYQEDAQHPRNLKIVRGGKRPRHTTELYSKIYKTADYLDFYKDEEYPVAVNWTQTLYFEVELLNNNNRQTELVLDHCWMTTTPDRNSLPQWHVIRAGCASNEEIFVTAFHPASNTHNIHQLKRFEVKIQKLSLADETALPKKVYGHCSIVICINNPDTNYSCDGQCTVEKGQNTYLNMQKDYVSLGEVWFFAGRLEQAKTEGGPTRSYWQWVLGSGLAIFLIVGIILVRVHVYH